MALACSSRKSGVIFQTWFEGTAYTHYSFNSHTLLRCLLFRSPPRHKPEGLTQGVVKVILSTLALIGVLIRCEKGFFLQLE